MKKYLDALERKFGKSTNEASEILDDIESRIAEILQQKITDSKQVIVLADIEEIVELIVITSYSIHYTKLYDLIPPYCLRAKG